MAIVQNPIIGRSSGKLANVIFYTVLEKNIIRSKPLVVANPRTIAQQQARVKLGVLSDLAKLYRTAINIGLKDEAGQMYPRNKFVQINYAAVEVDTSLVVTITYEDLFVAKGGNGTLTGVAAAKGATDLVVTWTAIDFTPSTDEVICITYSDGTIAGTRTRINAATASSGTYTQAASPAQVGDWVYIFMYNLVTLQSSDSVYVEITA